MADMMKVALSTQAAAAHWGEGAQPQFQWQQGPVYAICLSILQVESQTHYLYNAAP